MRKFIFLISLVLLTSTGCKKEGQVCYICSDALGNPLQETCGKNEQDAFDHSGLIEGVHDIDKFRQRCHKK
ncbi:MAG: hypothetical protein ABI666_12435 [Ferruginibacter sp.]